MKPAKTAKDNISRQDLIDALPIGIYRTTPDGRLIDANPALVELLGFPDRESLLAIRVTELFPDLLERQKELKLLQDSQVLQSYEMRLRRYDGRVIWVSDHARAVPDSKGGIAFYEGSLIDVTARRTAEEALHKLNQELDQRIRERTAALEKEIHERQRAETSLRESEQKFRLLFEESQDAIFFASLQDRLLDINRAGVELFAFRDRDEMLKTRISSLFKNPEELVELTGTIERTGSVRDYEIIARRRDGSLMTLLNTANAVRDRDGRLLFIMGMLRDITQKRKLEKQLFQAQKMEAVGLLASGVAHDFNNLLTVILGNVELGLLRSAANDPAASVLNRIRDAAEKASVLTQKLLAFSRQQMLYMGQVHVGKLLRNFQPILERLVGPDIDLRISVSASAGYVWADPGALEQVIMNLAVNAREAMAQGGRLEIKISSRRTDDKFLASFPFFKPGPYIKITVSDNGCGMNKATLAKVFEPFFTTKSTGTGLGLSVVFGIVKQHKGYVLIKSKPGCGSRFDVYLPSRQITAETREELKPGKDLTSGKGVILLAEDDETVREVLYKLLSGLGYSVILAADGEEARQLFFRAERRIDLLIFDIVMPHLSGPQAYAAIKAHSPGIPVLLLSGISAESRKNHLNDFPDLPVLLKPVNMVEFSFKVHELIATRRI